MDLWNEFGMDERITGLCQELGISAGTAIIVLTALYFVIKWAVRNGIMEGCKKLEEKKAQNDVKTEKSVNQNRGMSRKLHRRSRCQRV